MAIHATQRLFNLRASLEDYIRDTLVTVDSVKVQWPNVPFDTSGVTSWIKLDYLSKAINVSFANVDGTNCGTDTVLLFQIACISRYGAATNAYTLANLRDTVAGRMHHNTPISIYDHKNSGNTVIDTARVVFRGENASFGVQFAAPFPDENLEIWVMTFALRYIETHANT